MRLPMKKALVGGAAALMLGGATIGMAFAQPAPAGPIASLASVVQEQDGHPDMQAFIDRVAQKLGVPSDKLKTAIEEARKELGMDKGGPGKERGDHPRGFGFRVDLHVAAQAIGITDGQLRQELPGKSLTQVAQAHSKNPADVATALKNAANAQIDKAVTAGRIPADQAATRKTEAATRIDDMMTKVMPQMPPGGQNGPRGPRGNGQQQPGQQSGQQGRSSQQS